MNRGMFFVILGNTSKKKLTDLYFILLIESLKVRKLRQRIRLVSLVLILSLTIV